MWTLELANLNECLTFKISIGNEQDVGINGARTNGQSGLKCSRDVVGNLWGG